MLRVLFALAILAAAVVIYTVVRLVLERRDRRARPPELPADDAPVSDAALEEFRRAARTRAERQRKAREVGASEPAVVPPEVVVEDDVFALDPVVDSSNESFVVTSSAPVQDVVAAVQRANDRFMLVDELGTEHSELPGGELYTPNYAADPVVGAGGVEGYLDCKGAIDPAMGETLRRILREELERLGHPARAAVATPR